MRRPGGWAAKLEASWWRAERPAWPLRLLASVFGLLSRLRRLLYRRGWLRSVRLPVPVIVVGNRIVGGAGKTPVTLALLEVLRTAGWRAGLVSRGHGGSASRSGMPMAVHRHSDAAEVGDEPLLMARRAGVPVWVGRDRAAAAQALLAAHPDVQVIVCDDGLQHLRLARDLECVVFDARGGGNGHLLPAGPLREALNTPSHARAQWLLYNAAAPSTVLPGHLVTRHLAGLVPLDGWWRGHAPQPFATLRGVAGPLWALAGIGAPQRFFDDLAAQGLRCQHVPLADHDRYAELPWPASVPQVVVTEKDAVKLNPQRVAAERPATQVWVAPMTLALPAELTTELVDELSRLKARPAAR